MKKDYETHHIHHSLCVTCPVPKRINQDFANIFISVNYFPLSVEVEEKTHKTCFLFGIFSVVRSALKAIISIETLKKKCLFYPTGIHIYHQHAPNLHCKLKFLTYQRQRRSLRHLRIKYFYSSGLNPFKQHTNEHCHLVTPVFQSCFQQAFIQ